MNGIDLKDEQLTLIKTTLHKHLPSDATVLLFGSRATGTAKPYSDIDLCIHASKPLSLEVLASMASEFEDSSLPFKVDMIDWHAIDDVFKKIIIRDGKKII